ncbi:MAG: class I SAM-dependent methyltransferase [Veillonellales bacterium]
MDDATQNHDLNETDFRFTGLDFERMLGEKLAAHIHQKIKAYNFLYQPITQIERDQLLKQILLTLLDDTIIAAGEHRYEQWEKGWSENLISLSHKDIHKAIIPKYFGKYTAVRMEQKFIKSLSPNFEYNALAVILDWLFSKYLRDAGSIYEFGCGTGYHLLRAREYNPTAALWGLDWAEASQKIIDQVSQRLRDNKLFAHKFNYFQPDYKFTLDPKSIVYTVASLEQVGTKFEEFVTYLIHNNPKLCIHVEPIAELLDENNLLDFLSIQYFKKRNYLSGFLPYLRKLERDGTIKILKCKRTNIGSLFIEGYSVVVWTPQV